MNSSDKADVATMGRRAGAGGGSDEPFVSFSAVNVVLVWIGPRRFCFYKRVLNKMVMQPVRVEHC